MAGKKTKVKKRQEKVAAEPLEFPEPADDLSVQLQAAEDELEPADVLRVERAPDLEQRVFLDPQDAIDMLTELQPQQAPGLLKLRFFAELIGSRRLKRLAELDMRQRVSTNRKGRGELVGLRSTESVKNFLRDSRSEREVLE